jgi:hypothetical protein
MALPHELECLLRMQKGSEQRSTYFRIARLPEAQTLPLTSRESACPPAALKLNYTCRRSRAEGDRCPLLTLSCRAGRRQPRQLSGVKRTYDLTTPWQLMTRSGHA